MMHANSPVIFMYNMMTYTLLTRSGRVMQFYVAEMAATYQRLYGGVVFTQQVLDTATESVTMATY